jgi:hypothetical protein
LAQYENGCEIHLAALHFHCYLWFAGCWYLIWIHRASKSSLLQLLLLLALLQECQRYLCSGFWEWPGYDICSRDEYPEWRIRLHFPIPSRTSLHLLQFYRIYNLLWLLVIFCTYNKRIRQISTIAFPTRYQWIECSTWVEASEYWVHSERWTLTSERLMDLRASKVRWQLNARKVLLPPAAEAYGGGPRRTFRGLSRLFGIDSILIS